jgi:flagellin
MSELAAQGANSTYTSQQRQALQKEYTSLLDEFDRIGSTTQFNGINLLRNQTPQTLSFMTGITGDAGSLIEVAAANSHRYAGVVGQRSDWNMNGLIQNSDTTVLRNYLLGTEVSNGTSTRPASDLVPSYAVLTTTDSTGRVVQVNAMIARLRGDIGSSTSNLSAVAALQELFIAATASDGEQATGNFTVSTGGNPLPNTYDLSFSFTSGATATLSLDLSGITFSNYEIAANGTQPSSIGFTNLLSEYSSRRALPVLQNRLNDLSQIQSQFGAVQSRLMTSYNLRSTQNEVLAAAASRIMDADIAADSAEYIRTSILQQTGAALLAQANQQPALALKLLR